MRVQRQTEITFWKCAQVRPTNKLIQLMLLLWQVQFAHRTSPFSISCLYRYQFHSWFQKTVCFWTYGLQRWRRMQIYRWCFLFTADLLFQARTLLHTFTYILFKYLFLDYNIVHHSCFRPVTVWPYSEFWTGQFLCLRPPIGVSETLCFRLVRPWLRASVRPVVRPVSTISYKPIDGISPNFGRWCSLRLNYLDFEGRGFKVKAQRG